VILNSNVLLAQRLLKEPKIDNVDAIYASLHTTDAKLFKEKLGTAASAARTVMDNMILLKKHGYRVQINYSLGDYNKDEFAKVLEFAMEQGIHLKAIALIRPHDKEGFYGGDWINPNWAEQIVEKDDRYHLRRVASREGFGGRTITWSQETKEGEAVTVEVKNIATGRLLTDYCKGCRYLHQCGYVCLGLMMMMSKMMADGGF
jgi:MoaA/NifB/PqqE/SkfB family radical SAM enzyme